MKKVLVSREGQYRKANLHTHSTLSDGHLSPAELKAAYQSKGYSILAITDHEILIDHSDLNDENFLTLTSYEVGCSEDVTPWMHAKTVHLNFYARDPHNVTQVCYHPDYLPGNARSYADKVLFTGPLFRREYTPENVNAMIRAAVDNGFLVCYNHPTWSLENYNNYTRYEGMFAMEIFNTGCVTEGSNDRNENIYDDLLRCGKRIFCVASDDAHTAFPIGNQNNDMFGGWVMVNCKNLDYPSVIDALSKGDFYASCGPEFREVSLENGRVHVECSAVRSVRYVSYGRHTSVFCNPGFAPVTSCDFPVDRDDRYFRIEALGFDGNRAYTNPCYLDEAE